MIGRFSLLASIAAAHGCYYFPEGLLDGGAADSDIVADVEAPFELAETCLGEVPMVIHDLMDVPIDLSGLADDITNIGFCTGADAPGNDGFFGVAMEAGEKWHFHLRTTSGDGLNPAIYVLDSSCDSRRCMAGDAIDECGLGRDEHLSFVAPRAGTYYVGIDSRVAGGASYHLFAVHPVCGDGNVDHSETCDDNNVEDGDGCDSLCRAEVTSGMMETEPNDDPTGANRLVMAQGTAMGRLGGRCDRDMFVFEIGERSELQVAVADASARPCIDGDPIFDLQLLAENGTTVVTRGIIGPGEVCPTLSATGLAAGTYYISVTTDESTRPFDYTLSLTTS